MEHLPECEWNDETRVNRRCICPALRACEQRVINTGAGAAADIEFGRQEGLREARDAVAAHIRADITSQHMFSGRKSGILAAIDALRDGPLTELSKKGWDHRG